MIMMTTLMILNDVDNFAYDVEIQPARRRRREARAGLGATIHRQAWRSRLLHDHDDDEEDNSLEGEDTVGWSLSAMQVIKRLSKATRREEAKVP